MRASSLLRNFSYGVALLATVILCTAQQGAQAVSSVPLGTASTYGVIATTTVTNTGSTVVTGDLAISPGTSLTGFPGAPNGVVTGATHLADSAATQAQSDVGIAYTAASALTPTSTVSGPLDGLTLTPGVYSSATSLSLSTNAVLTLNGNSSSVWVFQAGSTLGLGSNAHIVFTGGASACNVFWRVGSSATLGSNSQFAGTILADASITLNTGASVDGRLFARTAAVTLDTNVITVPTGCNNVSPTITSGAPPSATVGTPYSFTVTASGTPSPTFSVTTGSLPGGLQLNQTSGVISGTPTSSGSLSVTITASNGATPASSATYTFVTSAATGGNTRGSGGSSGGSGGTTGGTGSSSGGTGSSSGGTGSSSGGSGGTTGGTGSSSGGSSSAGSLNAATLARSGTEMAPPLLVGFALAATGIVFVLSARRLSARHAPRHARPRGRS